MFEKRKLTKAAERILEILPQNEPCFDMRNFPGISEDEIPDCENIFIMDGHLSSAVCAAYCYHVIRKRSGHTPQIRMIGKNGGHGHDILTSLGVHWAAIYLAESVKEFYSCKNLGKNLLVLLPLHASFKIKDEAMRWNFALIGNSRFLHIREDFDELRKTENFFADLYETVKVAEYNLGKRRILPPDEEIEAYCAKYYGLLAGSGPEAIRLLKLYKEKYEALHKKQKDGFNATNRQMRKQKKQLIRKFASVVLP